MACHQCRTGRIKCDGVKPQCATCARLDRNCEYSRIDGRKSRHTESEFSALNNRIAFLESQLRKAQASASLGLDLMTDSTWDAHYGVAVQSDFEEHEEMKLERPLESLKFSVLGLEFDDEKLTTSALGAMCSVNGALIHDEVAGKTVYVGPTSNFHLLPASGTMRPSIAEKVAHYRRTEWLPTEIEYLRSYWDHVHSHFPLFSSPAELQQTAATNLLLKISVLGVGAFFCHSDSDPERQHQVNLAFSSRFTELSGGEIEHVCIPNIKSFLLRSYLAILQGKLESAAVFLGMLSCETLHSLTSTLNGNV
ncbi:hypothetical protein GCG54_00008569 [Colletotrichum gloeosporioides]|uniref:Zn(2)-C6 fungal-type domain-containing protein n=1 Tax=Colletotrichum gloeosporioides TaxID=474922 RepID=A0A8H4C539_COLGL|nr:uncharacterized protein GCG54_00008569 [Colletotrichum gloeosporioides]KAF3797574.1 hypothetical protein GCG54_00008569 [Colletotrichum gloeosporioides]